MASQLLDFKRGSRPRRLRPKLCVESTTAPAAEEAQVSAKTLPVQTVGRACGAPLDYPTIANWLQICEEDFERGRDKHEYTKLAPMFAANGCTRIDDIPRMSTDSIKSLTVEAGLDVTIGLVNRVHDYAVEDVARVKHDGKLVL